MIEIRQAEFPDIPALYGLAQAIGSRKEEGYFERCLAEQAEGRRQVFIASLGGQPVSYAMLNWQPQYALYKKLGMPEIQDLNTVPAARRQGAGGALIDHCENLAREKGCAHMGISVGLYADYGPAQRLYVNRGYVPDGFGVTYDRKTVRPAEIWPVDDNLCLMMVKEL